MVFLMILKTDLRRKPSDRSSTMSVTEERNRRRDDQITKILGQQSTVLSNLASQVRELKDVPKQLAVMENKIGNLVDLNQTVGELVISATKHKTLSAVLGGAIVLLFPLVVTWNYQLRIELAEIQQTLTILKERQERYNVRPPGANLRTGQEYIIRYAGETSRF